MVAPLALPQGQNQVPRVLRTILSFTCDHNFLPNDIDLEYFLSKLSPDNALGGGSMSPAEALNTVPGNDKWVILVVDDENGIREFLCTYLKSKSFKVLSAASGEDAMRIWDDEDGKIDLLLTDVVMPGINGKDLADRLKSQRPDLSIIFMSGYLPEEIAEEALGDRFFKKPFHPTELLEAIRETLH
jgi:two-component system, cell cycle sensor histidine kinase and response regulator CckA